MGMSVVVPAAVCCRIHPDFYRARAWSAVRAAIQMAVKHLIERAIGEQLPLSPGKGGRGPDDPNDLRVVVNLAEPAQTVIEDMAFDAGLADSQVMLQFLMAAVDAGFLDDYLSSQVGPRRLEDLDPENADDAAALIEAGKDDVMQELALGDIPGFDLVAETEKARLWHCAAGPFWEAKNQSSVAAPIRFASGLSRAADNIMDQIQKFGGWVLVSVVEESPGGGVNVEFLARIAEGEGRGHSVLKTAWLPANSLHRVGGAVYAEAFALKQKLAKAAEYGRTRSSRANQGRIKNWAPERARLIVETEAFKPWLQTQVASAIKQRLAV